MNKVFTTIGVVVTTVLVLLILFVGSLFLNAGRAVHDEFGPKAAIRKYEWFKDAYGVIQARNADIKQRESYLSSLILIKDKTREDKAELFQTRSELFGLIASYNSLVEEYNANSAKSNVNFALSNNLPSKVELYRKNNQ